MNAFVSKTSLLILAVALASFGCSKNYSNGEQVSSSLSYSLCAIVKDKCVPHNPDVHIDDEEKQKADAVRDCVTSLGNDLKNYVDQNQIKFELKKVLECANALDSSIFNCNDLPTLMTAPPEECSPIKGWFTSGSL